MKLVPRIVFEAPLDDDGREALVVAVAPGDGLLLQFALTDARLRASSAANPPTLRLDRDAAVALAREVLVQLAPNLAARLDARERPALRVVGNDDPGPEAA